MYDHRRYLRRETIDRFTAVQGPQAAAALGLGWDKPLPGHWTRRVFSAAAYGLTGSAGTSIWIDPERQFFIILLTHRLDPSRENGITDEARRAIIESVIAALR